MKCWLDRNEWWPVYTLDGAGYGKEIDIPDDFYNQYLEVMDKMFDIQEELQKLYKNDI